MEDVVPTEGPQGAPSSQAALMYVNPTHFSQKVLRLWYSNAAERQQCLHAMYGQQGRHH